MAEGMAYVAHFRRGLVLPYAPPHSYADFLAARLVLRPLNMAFPIDLIEVGPEKSPSEWIAGRVVLIINDP
jgi:hypothetical protein